MLDRDIIYDVRYMVPIEEPCPVTWLCGMRENTGRFIPELLDRVAVRTVKGFLARPNEGTLIVVSYNEC